jgi:hypothetical protein
MLEIMKRNKILTYAFLMAIPMTTGNIFSSCTDDFEKLNTSNIQVDPADLPFAAQCTEPMTYCYPPQLCPRFSPISPLVKLPLGVIK